jgi:PIN domain nuclease of toxin-antitoxin system
MKLLLDTHAFLWWESDPHLLSAAALAAFRNPGAELLLSVASAWEMQIKRQIGKLKLLRPLADVIADQQTNTSLRLVPVTFDHVLELDQLPLAHRDPFDRMLVAQARVEGATILSADAVFARYPVPVVW